MQISSKCYYALRALFELASQARRGQQPVKSSEIAQRQRIPRRFLEVILSELRQGGFVESRRGAEGGYLLAREASQVTVGEVVRFVDGDIAPVGCVLAGEAGRSCELDLNCPFHEFWLEVKEATERAYDSASLDELVERWNHRNAKLNPSYEI